MDGAADADRASVPDGVRPAPAVLSVPFGVGPAPAVLSVPDGVGTTPAAASLPDGVGPAPAVLSVPEGVGPAPAAASLPDGVEPVPPAFGVRIGGRGAGLGTEARSPPGTEARSPSGALSAPPDVRPPLSPAPCQSNPSNLGRPGVPALRRTRSPKACHSVLSVTRPPEATDSRPASSDDGAEPDPDSPSPTLGG